MTTMAMAMDPSPRRGNAAVSGELHAKSKLDWEKVRFIRDNPEKLSPKDLAARLGVNTTTIHQVQQHLSWKEK